MSLLSCLFSSRENCVNDARNKSLCVNDARNKSLYISNSNFLMSLYLTLCNFLCFAEKYKACHEN